MTQTRGRPRTYDRDRALDAALFTFWTHGYEGASLSRLAAAMKMNRPSLYAAFGDKRALFTAAMDHFTGRLRAHAQTALAHPDLACALRGLFAGLIELYRPGGQGRGCLVFLVGAAAAVDDEDARAAVAKALADLDAALRRRFAQGGRDGHVPATPDAAARAALTASVVHGLSVRARAGTSARGLATFVDRCLPLLLA